MSYEEDNTAAKTTNNEESKMQHTLETVAKAMSQNYNINLVCEGSQAYTDNKKVVIPALPNNMTAEDRVILRGYCDHEIGHILHSSFDILKDPEIAGNAQLKTVLNVIEDIRIEKLQAAKYAGTKANMNAVINSLLTSGKVKNNPLMKVFIEGRRHAIGYDIDAPDYSADVKRDFGEDILEQIGALTDSFDALRLAKRMINDYSKDQKTQESGGGQEEAQEGQHREELNSDMLLGDNKTSGLDNLENPMDELEDWLRKKHASALQDYGQYMVYSRQYDKEFVVPEANDIEIFNQMKGELGNLDTHRVKIGQMFLAKTESKWLGGMERGRINARDLARVPAGYQTPFKKKVVSVDRDTAVTFLVDHSGSMRGKLIRDAMKAVILFLETMTFSKVKTEVLGYTTKSYPMAVKERIGGERNSYLYTRQEALQHYIYKSFNEPYTGNVKRRISNYRKLDENNNADPEAIEWAVGRLMQRPEQRKILIVLTDGCVAVRGDCNKARGYMKKLLARLHNEKKIQVIGLGLYEPDVKEYYPEYVYIESPGYGKKKDKSDLIQVMLDQLKKILAV
jgi:cobalamin biosynthesis protein CobT